MSKQARITQARITEIDWHMFLCSLAMGFLTWTLLVKIAGTSPFDWPLGIGAFAFVAAWSNFHFKLCLKELK